MADTDIVLVNDEINEGVRETNLLSVDMVLSNFICIFLFFLSKLIVFQKHNGNCQIQNEERANDNAKEEVDIHNPANVSISIYICYVYPALKGNTLEDCEECCEHRVKA